MRELDADAREHIKRLLEGVPSKATLAMYLGRAMRDLDECDRVFRYLRDQQDGLRATLSETERRLAEAETLLAKNSLYRVWKKRIEEMVSLQEKLAEAEAKASAAEAERIAALMCLGELEARRSECEALRNEVTPLRNEVTILRAVERAARIVAFEAENGDVDEDGNSFVANVPHEALEQLDENLAAVDALRDKKEKPAQKAPEEER